MGSYLPSPSLEKLAERSYALPDPLIRKFQFLTTVNEHAKLQIQLGYFVNDHSLCSVGIGRVCDKKNSDSCLTGLVLIGL